MRINAYYDTYLGYFVDIVERLPDMTVYVETFDKGESYKYYTHINNLIKI